MHFRHARFVMSKTLIEPRRKSRLSCPSPRALKPKMIIWRYSATWLSVGKTSTSRCRDLMGLNSSENSGTTTSCHSGRLLTSSGPIPSFRKFFREGESCSASTSKVWPSSSMFLRQHSSGRRARGLPPCSACAGAPQAKWRPSAPRLKGLVRLARLAASRQWRHGERYA
jgi:hypothetical protein